MISILAPTRNRPGNVVRLVQSVLDTAQGEVEFVFYVDEDDHTVSQWVNTQLDGGWLSVVAGPRIILSQMWNECYARARGDILMHCGDDIVFRTPGWDKLVRAEFDKVPDRLVLVHGRDGYQDQRLATHGFYSREWVKAVGYFMPPYFVSDFNDRWWTEVADAVGRRVYLSELYTEHMHPVNGKGEWDATHRERIRRHRQQRPDQLYRRLAHVRERDIYKLRAAIEATTTVDSSDRDTGVPQEQPS